MQVPVEDERQGMGVGGRGGSGGRRLWFVCSQQDRESIVH